MSEKIQCPSCGKNIKATSVYCGYCGAEVRNMYSAGATSSAPSAPVEKVKVCTICGAQMNERANFCGKCGGELVLKEKTTDVTPPTPPVPPVPPTPPVPPVPPTPPTPTPPVTPGIKYPAGAAPVSTPPAKPVSHGFRMTTPDDLL